MLIDTGAEGGNYVLNAFVKADKNAGRGGASIVSPVGRGFLLTAYL